VFVSAGATGALQLVKETKSGLVFLRGGKIVHAENNDRARRDAFLEMVSWSLLNSTYETQCPTSLEQSRSALARCFDRGGHRGKQENSIKSAAPIG